jgi:hypothetical protein
MHSAVVRAVKPSGSGETGGTAAAAAACCGVTACCTPDERATAPSTTVAEAKAASGCGCRN